LNSQKAKISHFLTTGLEPWAFIYPISHLTTGFLVIEIFEKPGPVVQETPQEVQKMSGPGLWIQKNPSLGPDPARPPQGILLDVLKCPPSHSNLLYPPKI